MPGMRARTFAAAVLLVGAGALLFALLRPPASGKLPGQAAPEPPAAATAAGAGGEPAPAAAAPLPRSLRGSEVDGSLAVGADGRFLPTPGARRLFDYFLSAAGEEPLDVIRERIALHVRGVLPPEAAAGAVEALERYLGYREALRQLARAGQVPDDLERRLQWIRELRQEELGPELARAFYAEEEEVMLVDLARREVLLDASLDAAERAQRLDALEARLPEAVRAARARATAPERTRREVERLRQRGASDAEVFAVREEAFGWEAAQRLAELDRSRAAWDERLADYRAARDALLADPELAPDARARAVEALREERFAGGERERVAALERVGAL
jgi:lipase chaperone LimK